MDADFEWAAVGPELSCSDLAESLAFYVDVLGFRIAYDRPKEGFAFLTFGQVQVMLEQANGYGATGPLERPLGRGA